MNWLRRIGFESKGLQRCVLGAGVSAGMLLFSTGGCARVLTITQQDYINTAMHKERRPDRRTGQPLELDVVCVYPKDLEEDKPQNAPLDPANHITSDTWYKHRPEPGRISGAEVFNLPKDQIYLLTDDATAFGRIVGKRLCGAKEDGKREVRIKGIKFKGLFDKRAIIYVFPKFIGLDREVLASQPARFNPPGAYTRNLFIEVGVIDPDGRAEQYIKNTTEPKLSTGASGRSEK